MKFFNVFKKPAATIKVGDKVVVGMICDSHIKNGDVCEVICLHTDGITVENYCGYILRLVNGENYWVKA